MQPPVAFRAAAKDADASHDLALLTQGVDAKLLLDRVRIWHRVQQGSAIHVMLEQVAAQERK